MGITGLLPLLKKATKRCHVRKFSGGTVAIDGYCWLHRGAFGCAQKLALGEPTNAYITFCMNFIQILLDNNVKPVVVLDGRDLPSKRETNRKRREKRKENKDLARKYLQQGKKKEAWECFTKSVDVTPQMARDFIKALRAKNIDYVIAPHEADAQLAYLATHGFVDCVITEDSDLVLFGCPKILFKMGNDGSGELFEAEKIPKCLDLTPKNFKFELFRWMCILSGCDYLESLPKIGMGRAKKVIYEGTHTDIRSMLQSIPAILVKLQIEVPEEYVEGFIQAENTFLYQLVYDTHQRKVLPLNPYPENIKPEDVPYAGTYEKDEIHLGVALGNLDIHSLKKVDSFDPLQGGYGPSSIWWTGERTETKYNPVGKEDVEIGMQIGSPTGPPAGSKKNKRPLAVVNSDNEEEDLMSLYGKKPEIQLKEEVATNSDDSSASKRRRVTRKPTVKEITQESPVKKRAAPFLKKSPEKGKRVHVKSRYFKEEVKTKPEPGPEPEEDSDETSDEAVVASEKPVLSIYSYDSGISQDTDDISAAGSQERAKVELKECSVVVQKITPEEITLDDDDDSSQEEEQVSDYFKPAARKASISPAKKPAKSPRQKTPTGKAGKPATGSKRTGLSRTAKKDPKQRSVLDMFGRN